jgi:DNA replication initiation complex subunit (GINS family)
MYREIFEILKKELETEDLQQLPDDFYNKVEKYIESLKKKSADPNQLCAKIASIELKNVMIMLDKLKEIRNIKMIHKHIGEIENIPIETKTKITVLEKIKEEQVQEPIKEETVSIQKESASVISQAMPQPHQRTLLLIRIFNDIPQITDTDGFIYGPFQKGDVVYLPEEIAMTLISRGIARKAQDDLEEGVKIENSR